MNDDKPFISDAAARYAETLLPALQSDLARGVRRRSAMRRAAGSCAAVALLAGVLVAAMYSARGPAPLSTATPVVDGASPVSPTPRIEIVRSLDAPSIERITGTVSSGAITISRVTEVDYASILVTDRELLELLNEIGRPTGLVRANGRVWLTAAVTDEEIGRRLDGG